MYTLIGGKATKNHLSDRQKDHSSKCINSTLLIARGTLKCLQDLEIGHDHLLPRS